MVARASATAVAVIGWAPAGPLPRRNEPVDISSIALAGPALERAAASRLHTLPCGAVLVVSAPDPRSGACVAVRVDAWSIGEPLALSPAASEMPGWRLLDFTADATGDWTVLEAVPGPPDEVRLRRLTGTGETRWSVTQPVGSPAALTQILSDGRSAYGVDAGPGRSIVAIGADGVGPVVGELADPGGVHFMNGSGTVGFVSDEPATGSRSWVTVDVKTGERSVLQIDGEHAWELDLPLGIDSEGRPYANRYGTFVRFDAAGRPDWELGVAEAVARDDHVWVQTSSGSDEGIVALALSDAGRAMHLQPPDIGVPARWRLADVAPGDDAFVLYAQPTREDAGVLASIGADGTPRGTRPASPDVWLRSFDLQIPQPPAITDAGEIDLATRGPDGLSIVRVTPSGA